MVMLTLAIARISPESPDAAAAARRYEAFVDAVRLVDPSSPVTVDTGAGWVLVDAEPQRRWDPRLLERLAGRADSGDVDAVVALEPVTDTVRDRSGALLDRDRLGRVGPVRIYRRSVLHGVGAEMGSDELAAVLGSGAAVATVRP